MSRLIDADALLEKMSGHCDVCQYHCHRKHTSCGECDWREAMSDVDDMDEIEATPVQHGHWEFIGGYGYQYRCSKCFMCAPHQTNYCPACGCKMDEVRE